MPKYIGRFAPSPSGPLHFGSLVTALGSYFQAKSQQGQWLVRIEDIDPPREMKNGADLILKTLEAYHLHWDGEIRYQSQCHDNYQAQIDEWLTNGIAYYCQCTRKKIKQSGDFYSGTCRDKQLNMPDNCSVRIGMHDAIYNFIDQKHGNIAIPHSIAEEDFIIKRRDGLFAYNLAVVLDDIDQGITEVVRGADLIELTGRQISLYHLLGKAEVSYLHLPLAVNQDGNKLSKQNHAPAIDITDPKPTLISAMQFLGFTLPDDFNSATIEQILLWGCNNWTVNQLPNSLSITF